jgi:TolA-binding protein
MASMRFYPARRSVCTLVLSLVTLAVPYCLNAAPGLDPSASHEKVMSSIVSVAINEVEGGTIVKILADGKVPECATDVIDSPARIVIDIPVAARSFESMTIPGSGPNLKDVRIGYHPERIRVVLDIDGPDVPIFTTTSTNNGVSVLLGSKRRTEGECGEADQIVADEQKKCEPQDIDGLIAIEQNDGEADTEYLLEAIQAYRARRWEEAIENLSQLTGSHQTGRYAERAYYLLAHSYKELYSRSAEDHFREIKAHYEDALNRFPGSTYGSSALLAIGDLCFTTKNYSEALVYYNLVIKRDHDSLTALRARMQKVRILLLRGKKNEALSILEYIVERYPGTPEEIEAKIELSKIFYDMNSFKKSLRMLTGLRSENVQYVYQYPEISLYLGYNYYQVGENRKAGENLLRFYNSCPEKKINHLVLTNIADAYKDEGLIGDAVKFYQLVLERYPDTEGALISLIRLAEQQEEGKLEIEDGIVSSVKIIGQEIGLPRKIYKDVMDNILSKGRENPLAQLALLKLAIIYQREGEHEKSFEALKELLKEYPRTSLKNECGQALSTTLSALLKGEMRGMRYRTIVNTYLKEKDLFLLIHSPDPFLIVARAFLFLDLQDLAMELFRRADPLLSEDEKPADLLFYVGSDFLKRDKLEEALSRFDLLTRNYPTDKKAPYACYMKGQIFLKQGRYHEAAEMFSSVLRYNLTRSKRTRVLIDKARALIECSMHGEAVKTIRKAESEMRSTPCHPHIYEELGDLYLRLGSPKEAISAFNSAIAMETDDAAITMLKFRVAECYSLLGKRKDCLAVYNQVSSLNDLFWSNLAKERTAELEFNGEISTMDAARKAPSTSQREEELLGVKRLISSWQKAWQEKDIQGYMANYSKDFFSLGLDREGWKRHRSEINKRGGQIKVGISNLKIKLQSSERATARFEQEYSYDSYHDRGEKTLQLIKKDGKWGIKTETWAPFRSGEGEYQAMSVSQS